MKKQNSLLLEGPLLPAIISYTIPIILTSLLQLLFNAADLVVVGRFCGSIYVAAVGATGSITNLVINLFIGLSIGAGVCAAHAIGSGDDKAVSKTVHTAIPTAIVSGLVLTVIGIIFSETFLSLMGTPSNILPHSTVYMQIYFAGMVFNMVYNFAASILRAAGDTKTPFIILSLAGVLNVILNVFFVIVFGMDVDGVALATSISQAFSAVFIIIALMKRDDALKFSFKKMRFYKREFLKIIRIGLPAGVQSSLFAISNVIIQSSINSFGDIAVSGNAAAANIEGFLYVTQNAFYQTAVNFVGQNVGAKNHRRAKKSVYYSLVTVAVVGTLFGALIYLATPKLLSIYITDSSEAISYGITRMTYICPLYFLCGIMDVSTGALRGSGHSFAPMLMSILGVCAFRILWIMTIFQIPKYHTLDCLYISYAISWFLTFIMQFSTFLFIFKKQTNKKTT